MWCAQVTPSPWQLACICSLNNELGTPPLLEGGLPDRTGHTLPLTTVQGTGAKMVLLSTLRHHGNKLLGTSVKDYLDRVKSGGKTHPRGKQGHSH